MTETLDRVFSALSDATRRGIVERLVGGPASVSALAEPLGMSLPGVLKHLRVLEAAGLVHREKAGRVVSVALAPEAMQEAAMWLSHYERFWNPRLDALGRFLYHQEQVDPWPRPAADPSSTSKGATTRRPKGSGRPGPTRRR